MPVQLFSYDKISDVRIAGSCRGGPPTAHCDMKIAFRHVRKYAHGVKTWGTKGKERGLGEVGCSAVSGKASAEPPGKS